MSAPMNSDTTLLTEHLTYRPAALIDDIINSINILAFKATDAVERGLLSASPSSLGFKAAPPSTSSSNTTPLPPAEAAKTEIETGVHQLETLLEAKIDKNFDKLEVYALRNILSVPADVHDWVRLGHYEGLVFGTAGSERGEGPTAESVGLQRRKLRETMKLRALLVEETRRNEVLIEKLRDALGVKQGGATMVKAEDEGREEERRKEQPVFAFLQDGMETIGAGTSTKPLETTTAFTLSQLPALKTLLQDLKPRLENLSNGKDGNDGLLGEEEKSWRRQRLEFVEKEARRHLEGVRGLELGEMGSVRDGEWQREGRKVGMSEVRDLEGVVGLLGEGGRDGNGDKMVEGA